MSDSSATNLRDHFPKCFDFMDSCFENKGNVLVHWWVFEILIFSVAGVSRSASTVIAYLMNKKEERYDKVFELVHSKRNVIMPNPSFGKQLRQYDKELIIQQQ
jgi:protein-tyrosine phosphatase